MRWCFFFFFCDWSLFCDVVLSVLSSFAIISLKEGKSSILAVVWLSVSRLGPGGAFSWSVIVTFPGHTLFLFAQKYKLSLGLH